MNIFNEQLSPHQEKKTNKNKREQTMLRTFPTHKFVLILILYCAINANENYNFLLHFILKEKLSK